VPPCLEPDEDSLTHLCFKDAPTRKAIEVIGFVLNLFVIIVYLLFLWALRGIAAMNADYWEKNKDTEEQSFKFEPDYSCKDVIDFIMGKYNPDNYKPPKKEVVEVKAATRDLNLPAPQPAGASKSDLQGMAQKLVGLLQQILNELQKIVDELKELEQKSKAQDKDAENLQREIEKFDAQTEAAMMLKRELLELLAGVEIHDDGSQIASEKDRKKTEKIRLEVDRQRGLLDEVKKRIENLIAPEFSPKDLGVVTGEWKTNPITAVAPAEDQPLCPDAGLEISSMIVC